MGCRSRPKNRNFIRGRAYPCSVLKGNQFRKRGINICILFS